MEKDFYRFYPKEKVAFDKAYPPEEIERFINAKGSDSVEIFEALKAFDFPDVRPDAKDIVIAHFSESRFAPQLNMHDGIDGKTMIYRGEIVPLLRASQEVFWQIFDLFTDETKTLVNQVFSTTNNSERDWQK